MAIIPTGTTKTFTTTGATTTGVTYNKIIPGKIEAESYTAYQGSIAKEATTDTGGGSNIGWLDTGEYIVYNSVNVLFDGEYTLEIRVSSPTMGGQLKINDAFGSFILVNIPNTGGWQNWVTVKTPKLFLKAGVQNLRVTIITGGFNLNWINFNLAGLAILASSSLSPNTTIAINAVGSVSIGGISFQIPSGFTITL